jgi:hypothetical protein
LKSRDRINRHASRKRWLFCFFESNLTLPATSQRGMLNIATLKFCYSKGAGI